MSNQGQPGLSAKTSLWICAVGLIVMTWIVYWPTLDYGFVDYDDNLYIVDNPRVEQGLTSDNIRWSMTALSVSNWHPLLWLSFMLDAELFGMGGGGFHLTNVILHTANGLLLLMFLWVTTRHVWLSAFVAAMFAIHPQHVESVAWVSERKDVLFLFFGMLSLLSYVRFIRTDRWLWYGLSLGMFVLSLASKQMLITLPFLMLLLDDWPLRRTPWRNPTDATDSNTATRHPSWQRLIAEKVPFLVLSVASGILTVSAQSGHFPGLERYTLPVRVMNAILVYCLYLCQTVWPTNLAAIYPHPLDEISRPAVIVSGLSLVVVTVAVVTQWRKRPYLPVGWFWYLGTLVPVIGLVQVGGQQMADRYTYFPIIGVLIAMTWWIASVAPNSWQSPFVAGPFAIVLIIAAIILARQQVKVWKDTESLWAHTLRVTEKNAAAHFSMGLVRNQQKRFDEAVQHFEKSVAIDPFNHKAHCDLGLACYRQGKLDEAIAHYRRSLELQPTYVTALTNLGIALLRINQPKESLKLLSRATEIEPDNVNAHAILGSVLMQLDRPDQAIEHFRQTVTLSPSDGRAQFQLAVLLHAKGELDAARAGYETALRINPQNADAHYRLGALLLQKNEQQLAAQHLQMALKLNPGHQQARELLQSLSGR
ncbi:MAG: tetratricopeptide repeat protein [Planctomycetaceae bacterium]|nr:tetratricopeptide repeat protein [Planctomycetaceae bacterium]